MCSPKPWPSSPRHSTRSVGELAIVRAFYDDPGEHGVHPLTNPIKLTLSTLRLRPWSQAGRDHVSRTDLAHNLLDAAHHEWRHVNAPERTALVRADASFMDDLLKEHDR